MEISDETKTLVNEFAERYLNLLLQKKAVDQDVKELKQEFDEQGVPTKIVMKAINNLKRNKKSNDSEKFEIEKFEAWLAENQKIDDVLTEVMA